MIFILFVQLLQHLLDHLLFIMKHLLGLGSSDRVSGLVVGRLIVWLEGLFDVLLVAGVRCEDGFPFKH